MSRFRNYKMKNNVNATLFANISSSATSIQVNEGEGSRFGTEFPMLATLENFNSDGSVFHREIVSITARENDTLTVERHKYPCLSSDDANTESQNSYSFNSGDRISIYIPKDILDRINDWIKYLEQNGTDRLKVLAAISGDPLKVDVMQWVYRSWGNTRQFSGQTNISLTANANNYVQIGFNADIIINTDAWDTRYARLARVLTDASWIVEIEDWRLDTVGGALGSIAIDELEEKLNLDLWDYFIVADSDDDYNNKKFSYESLAYWQTFGNGSDWNLVIPSGCCCMIEAKNYQFNNLTICSGWLLRFCGDWVPVLRVKGCFCNLGKISTYWPYVTNKDVALQVWWVIHNVKNTCNWFTAFEPFSKVVWKGGTGWAAGASPGWNWGDWGDSWANGCKGCTSYWGNWGSSAECAGGWWGWWWTCYYKCYDARHRSNWWAWGNATACIGWNWGNGWWGQSCSAYHWGGWGWGYGYLCGGNWGCWWGWGYSCVWQWGRGWDGYLCKGWDGWAWGYAYCALQWKWGNGWDSYCGTWGNGWVGWPGWNWGCSVYWNWGNWGNWGSNSTSYWSWWVWGRGWDSVYGTWGNWGNGWQNNIWGNGWNSYYWKWGNGWTGSNAPWYSWQACGCIGWKGGCSIFGNWGDAWNSGTSYANHCWPVRWNDWGDSLYWTWGKGWVAGACRYAQGTPGRWWFGRNWGEGGQARLGTCTSCVYWYCTGWKWGDAWGGQYALFILACRGCNVCIDASWGNGWKWGCAPITCWKGWDGWNGWVWWEVMILYRCSFTQGSINVSWWAWGAAGTWNCANGTAGTAWRNGCCSIAQLIV